MLSKDKTASQLRLTEVTPDRMITSCAGIMSCPAIFKDEHGTYYIIGRNVLGGIPEDIIKRIGPGETLIEVPNELIDGLRKG